MNKADEKLKRLEKEVIQASNTKLIDSLIKHSGKGTRYYKAIKIIKEELLKRMK